MCESVMYFRVRCYYLVRKRGADFKVALLDYHRFCFNSSWYYIECAIIQHVRNLILIMRNILQYSIITIFYMYE